MQKYKALMQRLIQCCQLKSQGLGLYFSLDRVIHKQLISVHMANQYIMPVQIPFLPICVSLAALIRLTASVIRFWKNSLKEYQKNPLEECFYPTILIEIKGKTPQFIYNSVFRISNVFTWFKNQYILKGKQRKVCFTCDPNHPLPLPSDSHYF